MDMDKDTILSACHRHDLTDAQWECIRGLLPGREGSRGRTAEDNRRFVNAVLWILRTGAPWRDLPPSYGGWKNTHRRFTRWRDKGIWEVLWVALRSQGAPDLVAIDGSYVKAHPPRFWRTRRLRGHRPRKRGRNTKLHLAADASGRPLRMSLTAGNVNDCTEAIPLLDLFKEISGCVLADRGYDSDHIVDYCAGRGLAPVIPPRSNRKEKRPYDATLYRLRHCVGNAFLRLKTWRSIGTRYAKRLTSFAAFVHLACAHMWLARI